MMHSSGAEHGGLGQAVGFVTKRQLAQLYQVCERTVDNWRSRGLRATVEQGRIVRFDPDEVKLWLMRDERWSK